jgi:predicted DCC family thiol-disulfide oxidoreductase YuxK
MSASPLVSLEVIYDGECPFCASYVAYCRIRDSFPDVVLTNARGVPARVATYRAQGMDINQGMIVIFGDAVYYGEEAMAILTQITRPGAFGQRIMRCLFKHQALGKIVYVIFRWGRNVALALLRRRKID